MHAFVIKLGGSFEAEYTRLVKRLSGSYAHYRGRSSSLERFPTRSDPLITLIYVRISRYTTYRRHPPGIDSCPLGALAITCTV